MSASDNDTVALVLNAELAGGLRGRLLSAWIVTSLAHSQAASALRHVDTTDITTVRPVAEESLTELLGRTVNLIEQHHGQSSGGTYRNLLILGMGTFPVPSALLEEYGFFTKKHGVDGVLLSKL